MLNSSTCVLRKEVFFGKAELLHGANFPNRFSSIFFFFLKGVYNVNLNSRLDKQLLITACSQRKRRLIPLRPQKGYLPCPALVLPHVSLLLFCQNCFNEDFAKQASFLPFSFDSLKEQKREKQNQKKPLKQKTNKQKTCPRPRQLGCDLCKMVISRLLCLKRKLKH